MRVLLCALLLCGCAATSAQSRPTVTPATVPTAQLDPGVIVWPFPLTPAPAYPAPLQAQSTTSTLQVVQGAQGIRVTWSSPTVVCPWLEYGAVQAYAGGAGPCRASGSALVTLIPDLPARLVLRRPDKSEVAAADVGYRVVLPWVAKE